MFLRVAVQQATCGVVNIVGEGIYVEGQLLSGGDEQCSRLHVEL